jgi:serine phosphatase RsbU (regulator of sigma subunit)
VASAALEPGDRLLLFTDGVVDGRAPDGSRFGEATLADLLVRATTSGLGTAETLRRLSHAVLEHQEHELTDDSTMFLIDFATD